MFCETYNNFIDFSKVEGAQLNKFVYRFNNKDSKKSFNSKDILGGKGANLAQMAGLNLPVPPGFTISTKICEFFYKIIKKFQKKLFNKPKKKLT